MSKRQKSQVQGKYLLASFIAPAFCCLFAHCLLLPFAHCCLLLFYPLRVAYCPLFGSHLLKKLTLCMKRRFSTIQRIGLFLGKYSLVSVFENLAFPNHIWNGSVEGSNLAKSLRCLQNFNIAFHLIFNFFLTACVSFASSCIDQRASTEARAGLRTIWSNY